MLDNYAECWVHAIMLDTYVAHMLHIRCMCISDMMFHVNPLIPAHLLALPVAHKRYNCSTDETLIAYYDIILPCVCTGRDLKASDVLLYAG